MFPHLLILSEEGMGRKELMNSGIPFGFGLLAIFQGSYQYLMDAYGPYAASAVCLIPHLIISTDNSSQVSHLLDMGSRD
jgi:hypothetical protein